MKTNDTIDKLVKIADIAYTVVLTNEQLQYAYPDLTVLTDIDSIGKLKHNSKACLLSPKCISSALHLAVITIEDLQLEKSRLLQELECMQSYQSMPLYKKLFISYAKYKVKCNKC